MRAPHQLSLRAAVAAAPAAAVKQSSPGSAERREASTGAQSGIRPRRGGGDRGAVALGTAATRASWVEELDQDLVQELQAGGRRGALPGTATACARKRAPPRPPASRSRCRTK